MVSAQFVQEFQDAYSCHPWTARLPARRERRLPAFHHAADYGRAVEDALFPRRRPLGAEAAEFAALVQDGQRLGGSVDEEVRRASLAGQAEGGCPYVSFSATFNRDSTEASEERAIPCHGAATSFVRREPPG